MCSFRYGSTHLHLSMRCASHVTLCMIFNMFYRHICLNLYVLCDNQHLNYLHAILESVLSICFIVINDLYYVKINNIILPQVQ